MHKSYGAFLSLQPSPLPLERMGELGSKRDRLRREVSCAPCPTCRDLRQERRSHTMLSPLPGYKTANQGQRKGPRLYRLPPARKMILHYHHAEKCGKRIKKTQSIPFLATLRTWCRAAAKRLLLVQQTSSVQPVFLPSETAKQGAVGCMLQKC